MLLVRSGPPDHTIGMFDRRPGPAATPQGTSATTAIADPPHDRPTGDALQFHNHGLYCNVGIGQGHDASSAHHDASSAHHDAS